MDPSKNVAANLSELKTQRRRCRSKGPQVALPSLADVCGDPVTPPPTRQWLTPEQSRCADDDPPSSGSPEKRLRIQGLSGLNSVLNTPW